MPKAKYNTEVVNGTKYYSYFYPLGTYNKSGKPEYKHIRAKTIKKMDDKIEAFRQSLESGIIQSDITVDQWYYRWLESYKKNKKETTKEFYRYIYKHISTAIGGIPVQKVRQIDCQKILTDMSESYALKTVKSVRSLMFGIFSAAKANGIIAVNPAENLDAEGASTKHRRELTEEERQQYLECCKRHPWGTQAAFLYWFGLRRGEMIALCADDIADEGIKINKQLIYPDNNLPIEAPPKTESGERVIPIPDSAREYIDFDALRSAKGRLFTMPDGRDTTYSSLRNGWRRFIREALGPDTDITIHYVRHNYCTMLIEHDVNVLAAKELMGHNNIETTIKTYSHYSERIQKIATDKIIAL